MVWHATNFFGGAIFAGYAVIGLFFFRFWTKTGDRLFGFFAAAFWMLAIEAFVLQRFGISDARYALIHFARLIAFGLIILGILDKNRAARRSG